MQRELCDVGVESVLGYYRTRSEVKTPRQNCSKKKAYGIIR